MLYQSLIKGEFIEWVFKPISLSFIPFMGSLIKVGGALLGKALGSKAATTAGSMLGSKLVGNAATTLLGSGIQGRSARDIAKANAAAARYGVDQRRKTALDQLLAGLDVGRSGQRRASDQYGRSMADFRQDTTGTPTQISKLQELIRQQALPEQRRAMSQGRLALQQQGVRGPESALMQQMQANTMQESLANRAQQIALQQQLRDRERRAQLAAAQSAQALPGSIAGTTNYKPS